MRVCLGDVREAILWSVLVDPCVFGDVYGMDGTGNQQADRQNQEPDSQALQGMWLGFNRSSSPFCFFARLPVAARVFRRDRTLERASWCISGFPVVKKK